MTYENFMEELHKLQENILKVSRVSYSWTSEIRDLQEIFNYFSRFLNFGNFEKFEVVQGKFESSRDVPKKAR